MTEEVIHDPIFLAGKLELTANENLYIAQDFRWEILYEPLFI